LLRIVYREDTRDQINSYRLNTVTYGLNCAPFLAMRCLHELTHQAERDHPQASETILKCFYMDDLFVGVDSSEQALKLRDDLIDILKQGGFELYKWASNNNDVLPQRSHPSKDLTVRLDSNFDTTALGLTWNCSKDLLKYHVTSIEFPTNATKRNVLSIIAKIFDPLGLITPIIIKMKVLLQQLWELN
jgi:hypothetical protein